MSSATKTSPERRRLLSVLGVGVATVAAGAGTALVAVLAGCDADAPRAAGDTAPSPPGVPLAELPVGARRNLTVDGVPIELSRDENGIVARSLLCSHQGCTVRWDGVARVYRCPCHGGVYAADGTVREGPPPRPLRTLPVRRVGDLVTVGG